MELKYEYYKEHIKKLGFDINIEDYPLLKESVKYYSEHEDINGLEHYMKQCQNCAGYALQIPICIFSGSKYTFEEQVLRITELYPFVRLLSDTKLRENEYIVKFRAGKTGHHFIKIDENGKATEKKECNLPRDFQGWGTLKNDPEAVFAVIKQDYRSDEIKKLPQCNKDMFLNEDAYYQIEEDGFKDIRKKEAKKPVTFKDKLKEAYCNRSSSFSYQNKNYYLKTDKNDPELIYICNDNEVLGELCTDGNNFVIELNNEKKNKILGFEPSTPVEIKQNKDDNCIEL